VVVAVRRLTAIVTVAGMTLLGAAGLGGPAQASGPVDVTITIIEAFPGGPPAGWFSSGAFTDSGSWTTDLVVGSLPSPTTAAFHRETTEIGSAGSFHMTIGFVRTFVGGVPVLRASTWFIPRTGTGAYASLTGQGSCSAALASDGTFHVTCVGQVNFV
jgi:hypothetical protein